MHVFYLVFIGAGGIVCLYSCENLGGEVKYLPEVTQQNQGLILLHIVHCSFHNVHCFSERLLAFHNG
jgi:hypothetical protein